MTYPMTFKGTLSFGDDDALVRALAIADDAKACLVRARDFERLQRRLRLSFEACAPASMWDSTCGVLSEIAAIAFDGRILCVFASDGEEDQIEVIGAGPWDESVLERGPFPAAFLGSLAFTDNAAAERAREGLRASLGPTAEALRPEIRGDELSIRQRKSCFRKEWCAIVAGLERLASTATRGTMEAQIKHLYLPDGEFARIAAGKRVVTVWE